MADTCPAQVVQPPSRGTAGFRRSNRAYARTEDKTKIEECRKCAQQCLADISEHCLADVRKVLNDKALQEARNDAEYEAYEEAQRLLQPTSFESDIGHFCGSPLQLLKRSTKRRATSECVVDVPKVITQKDLDKTLAESGFMTEWEPDNYRLVKKLALAAAGEGIVVVMSSYEQLGELVAVKSLPFYLVQSGPEEFKKHNPDEAEQPWTDIAIVRHLNSIQYPHVVELLDVCLGNDEVNIVSSLATNGDLFSWVEADPSELGEARETAMRPIVSEMLKAVRWLHDLGIAHRDLSMENVVLTKAFGKDGLDVKIIDFGMATLSRTAENEVRGKRGYQAPEMFESDKYDTFLSDNFALGMILFFLGAHQYPWDDTRPGKKDRRYEYARAHGLEAFMARRRMPCGEKRVAEVFTESYLDLVCGLLNFDPEIRYTLGEACFHPITLDKVKSKTPWLSMEEAMSEMSTACPSLESLPAFADETALAQRNEDCFKTQEFSPRLSVWDCSWLIV